jgi:hypothetical protein
MRAAFPDMRIIMDALGIMAPLGVFLPAAT